MIIIGISGKALSGKTTVAHNLTKLIKGPTATIAFADSLKDEVAKACGVTREYIELNKSVFRPILQWWGTDFRRNLCKKSYWIEKVMEKIVALPKDNIAIIIPDVRFINEAEWIEQFDTGFLVQVIRPNVRILESKHISETEMDSYKCEFIIDNSTDLQNLLNQTNHLRLAINETLTLKHNV